MIVVAWNMGRRHDRAAWKYSLDDLKPEIELLQETTPPAEAFARGWLCHARAYARHSWGSAVYVREGRARELPLVSEHRGWLMAAEASSLAECAWRPSACMLGSSTDTC